jgi:hypothetical protein
MKDFLTPLALTALWLACLVLLFLAPALSLPDRPNRLLTFALSTEVIAPALLSTLALYAFRRSHYPRRTRL